MRRAKTVMAFGSFDLLHPGHLLYLEKAKRLGGSLIVVVARDSSIEAIKHRKPVVGERARLRMVGALKVVDRAVLGNRLSKPSDRYRIIGKYMPNVIAFGYDQQVDLKGLKEWLKKNGFRIRIVSIKTSKNMRVFKSSKLRAAIGDF
jgi:FAD synthetase